jgi:hypothetical protein
MQMESALNVPKVIRSVIIARFRPISTVFADAPIHLLFLITAYKIITVKQVFM